MRSRRNAGFVRGFGHLLPAEPRPSRGFALLIVLWVLVLVAFLVAQVTAAGRTELRIARNHYANAAAEAALLGAIDEAIFNIADPEPERAWQLDGGLHDLAIGHSRIVVRIDNEAARINPNYAPPALLEALLRATGSDQATAQTLAIAIAEWVGTSAAGRSGAVTVADHPVSGQPMETLEELAQVRGMTPEILAAIRPHLSLYAPQTPDSAAADPVVAAALGVVREPPRASRARRGRRGGYMTARITGTAYGPENAEVTSIAVVRLNRAIPGHGVKLAWGASVD